jgi:hypothetical protein
VADYFCCDCSRLLLAKTGRATVIWQCPFWRRKADMADL